MFNKGHYRTGFSIGPVNGLKQSIITSILYCRALVGVLNMHAVKLMLCTLG